MPGQKKYVTWREKCEAEKPAVANHDAEKNEADTQVDEGCAEETSEYG